MDRNTVIGFVLIALLIIAYTYFNMPSKEELEKQKHQADSIALVQKQQHVSDSLQQLNPADSSKHAVANSTTTVVSSDVTQMQKVFPDSNTN